MAVKTMKDTVQLKRENLFYTKHLHYRGWAIFLEKGALYNYFRSLLIALIGHPNLVQLRIASKNDTLLFFLQKMEKSEFLSFFYKHSMHVLTAPLFATTCDDKPSKGK